MREVVIDTETTGLDYRQGHRVIELAAVELDGVRIGRRWHSLFDPGRPIEPGAIAVHGITDADVKGQPKFADIAEDFLAFIDGSTLIAHNAPFDCGFITSEMWRAGRAGWRAEWIDTLPIARKKLPRMKHTLDDLCRHYGIRKAKRRIHGAILDCLLLAEVYARLDGRLDQLAMDGMDGGDRIWLAGGEMIILAPCDLPHPGPRPAPLPSRLGLDELRAHKRFMQQLMKDRAHAGDGG